MSMTNLNKKIDTWIFDLDNTLYSADSGIFQQVHVLMGEFVSKRLKIDINEAKIIQKKYLKLFHQSSIFIFNPLQLSNITSQ